MQLSESEQARWQSELHFGDKSRRPGLVRISFGAYNSFEDIDALIEMLWRITRKEYKGDYFPVPETGEYLPSGYRDTIADCFSLAGKSFSRQITSRAGLARARIGIASG